MRSDKQRIVKAFKTAFPYTLPIFAGFWFLGIAYGVYMNVEGFSFVYPMLMALLIFGGSLEFVCVGMLLSPFAPVTTLLVSLAVQARHLFYGIAMLDKYKNTGWMKPFLIFGLCDETFSIIYTAEIPEDVDRRWFMLFVTWLDQFYWVSGATIGGLLGDFLPFNTEGLSFVMTALFVVILLDQLLKEKHHWTAAIGAAASAGCLAVFGPNDFMIPAMICMIVVFAVFEKPLTERRLIE